jgi:hypothetical protein
MTYTFVKITFSAHQSNWLSISMKWTCKSHLLSFVIRVHLEAEEIQRVSTCPPQSAQSATRGKLLYSCFLLGALAVACYRPSLTIFRDVVYIRQDAAFFAMRTIVD